MKTSSLKLKKKFQTLLLTILLLITTTSFAADTSSKSQIDLKEITLITPYLTDENQAFKLAFVDVGFPGRGVCLPPTEYQRMRAVDLAYIPIKNHCLKAGNSETFWQDFGAGILTGFALGALLTKFH